MSASLMPVDEAKLALEGAGFRVVRERYVLRVDKPAAMAATANGKPVRHLHITGNGVPRWQISKLLEEAKKYV